MRHELFAVTAPGIEQVTAGELKALGVSGSIEPGGISWSGGPESLYLANLHLRTASRVLALVTEFKARSFIELERHLRRIDWGPYLRSGDRVTLRVSSRKSKLYHKRAIEERFAREIDAAVGVEVLTGRDEREEEEEGAYEPAQLFIVRFNRDRCVVRADTSGELLHRRGYRQAVGRAPLRETLAAAMLLGSGWRPGDTLLDPLCGSGTVPIEAALIARRIAPGIASADRSTRAFAFQRWPDFQPAVWDRIVAAARAEIVDAPPVEIRGSDRDSGAIEAARANAARAGVEHDVCFEERALSAAAPSAPAERGWVITNPPYGQRVGEVGRLRDLYAALGKLLRRELPDWCLAMLSADRELERQIDLPLREAFSTRNGGIPVRLMIHERNG